MLASTSRRQHSSNHLLIPSPLSIIPQSQPQYPNNTTATINNTYSFGADQPLFDFQPQQFDSSQSLMQTEQSNTTNWGLSNGQLTPQSTTRSHHHRESSLSSSLGSAGPASPYTANTSNPQVAGDLYHDFHDFQQPSSKPLTPVHTPSQEQFLVPQYSNFYHPSNLGYTMGNDTLQKPVGDVELMPSAEFNNQSARPSMSTVARRDSPSTPPSYEEERRKNGFRNTAPKLDRTMTDVYADELYNPSFQITTAPPPQMALTTTPLSPQNDVFTQRLQAAHNQHLSASNTQTPLTITSRDRSPFRQGSPLAPSVNNFGQQAASVRFGSASELRERQKVENDAQSLQQQLQYNHNRNSGDNTPKTISPKDVDLVYHESDEDSKVPLFPSTTSQQRLSPNYRQQPAMAQETSDLDDNASQQSYGSMATSRRESSSAFSGSSQVQQQTGYNFAPPSLPASSRQIPQQYPFVPQTRRQPSGLSAVSEGFPSTLTSMESSSSEYAPETSDIKKPSSVSADTGTYTCTYHGCTLRFDTPAKLQRHKREGHRNSASVTGGVDEGGMTSAAQRNSQAGPHKCERNNPSTGKPCNTIFSRPYDLTRHEDTIHNARKQKVHCPLCTEEKSFSRNDALTRHLRVVHPDHVEMSKGRRRGVHD